MAWSGWVHAWILGGILGASALALAQPSAPDEIRYSYAGSSVFEGRFSGACEGLGAFTPKGRAGEWVLTLDEGVLSIRESWENFTRIDDFYMSDGRTQRETNETVGPGTVEISWPANGTAVAFPYRWYQNRESEPFRLSFETDRLEVAPLKPSPDAPTNFLVRYSDGTVFLAGWFGEGGREVRQPEGFTLAGDTSIFTRNSVLTLPDGRVMALGQPYEDHVVADGAIVSKHAVRHVDAILHAKGVKLHFEPSEAGAICRAIQGRAFGAVTAAAATGSMSVEGSEIALDEQVLSFAGDFMWDERPVEERVESRALGSISSLSVDFTPSSIKTQAAGFPTEFGLGALAVLLLIGLFKQAGSIAGIYYARFGPERVLEHPRRRLLLESVEATPGLTATQLSERLQLPFNSLKFHLTVLGRTRKLRVQKEGKFLRVWPLAMPQPGSDAYRRAIVGNSETLAYVLGSLNGAAILRSVMVRSLAERFNMSERGARDVLARATRLRLISIDPEGVVKCV